MLTAAVLCFALGATPAEADEPVRRDLVPAARPTPSPGVVDFDALPPKVTLSDDVRIKRFLGAFAGGVVGLGAALALMPLGDGLTGCFPATTCVSFVHVLAGGFAPLLALGGAWLGYEILGGDGGLFTPSAALAPALLVALGLLAISQQADAQSIGSMVPFLVASGAFLAGGAALALDSRSQQLAGLGGASGWGQANGGRVALTALIIALTGTAAGFASALVGALLSFSGSSGVGVVAGVVAAVLGTLGTAAAAWGVHRAMGGRGSFGAALLGLGMGWLVMAAGTGLFALSQGGFATFSPLRNAASGIFLAELGVASALFFPTLALEWSHTDAVDASLPRFGFSAAPLKDGAMVAAAMQF